MKVYMKSWKACLSRDKVKLIGIDDILPPIDVETLLGQMIEVGLHIVVLSECHRGVIGV